MDAILADNHKEFTSNAIKEICTRQNINDKHTLTFTACPNSSERIHKNLREILRALVGENQRSWDKYIPAITLDFKSAKSRATNYSPFFLMFGRSPSIELDIIEDNPNPEVPEDQFVADTLERMTKAFNVVEQQIKKNLDYRLKEYSPAQKAIYEVGNYVLLFSPTRKSGEASKLKRGWSLPFIITKKINDICFEMESLEWASPKFKVVRSQTHMKLYQGPTNFGGTRKNIIQ